MKNLNIFLVGILLFSAHAWSATLNEILDQSEQIVLTVGKDENSSRGRVETWEKKITNGFRLAQYTKLN